MSQTGCCIGHITGDKQCALDPDDPQLAAVRLDCAAMKLEVLQVRFARSHGINHANNMVLECSETIHYAHLYCFTRNT